MPLTAKGREIEKKMEQEYGEKRGERVFYASKNAGTISGVDEAQRQHERMQAGEYVSGRDRAKLKRR